MALTDTFPTADAGGLTIADLRAINVGDVVKNANGTPRLGLFPTNATLGVMRTSSSALAVTVDPFTAVVSRTGGRTAEKIANPAAQSVPLPAAPSSNSRIDVVYAMPRFTASGDSSNVPTFLVQSGAAASNPQKPTVPAGGLEIGTVLVPSTATTTQSTGVIVSDTAQYTAAAGGTVVVRTPAEMASFVPVAGTTAFLLETRQMWSYDGSNWTLAQPGIVLIRPGGVSGGSIDSTGTILATGGNSIRIDDCFSARYRHYRVIVSAKLSGPGNMRINLTRGGVDRNQSNYFTSSVYSPSFAAKDSQALTHGEYPNSNWFLQVVASTKKMLAMDIFNPAQGSETFASGMYASFGQFASHQSWSGSYETNEVNDGLRLWIFESGITYSSVDIKIYAYA